MPRSRSGTALALVRRVSRSSAFCCAVQVLLSTWTLGAWAQDPAEVEPPLPNDVGADPIVNPTHTGPSLAFTDRILYSIRTLTRGRRFDVRTPDEGEVIARCVGHCTLALPQGSYQLRLYDGAGSPDGDTDFRVSGPGSLEVEDANSNVARVGAIMGSVGPVLIVTGSLLLLRSICMEACPNHDSSATWGLATLITGAALTPIGWVIYARNREPRTKAQPLLMPYAAATRDKSGGVIGLQGAF